MKGGTATWSSDVRPQGAWPQASIADASVARGLTLARPVLSASNAAFVECRLLIVPGLANIAADRRLRRPPNPGGDAHGVWPENASTSTARTVCGCRRPCTPGDTGVVRGADGGRAGRRVVCRLRRGKR